MNKIDKAEKEDSTKNLLPEKKEIVDFLKHVANSENAMNIISEKELEDIETLKTEIQDTVNELIILKSTDTKH